MSLSSDSHSDSHSPGASHKTRSLEDEAAVAKRSGITWDMESFTFCVAAEFQIKSFNIFENISFKGKVLILTFFVSSQSPRLPNFASWREAGRGSKCAMASQ